MRSLKLYFPYRSQRTPLVDYALLLTGVLLLLGVAYQFKQITTDVHAWEVREAHFMQQQREPAIQSANCAYQESNTAGSETGQRCFAAAGFALGTAI